MILYTKYNFKYICARNYRLKGLKTSLLNKHDIHHTHETFIEKNQQILNIYEQSFTHLILNHLFRIIIFK
jgi:hypothetical protein